MAVLSIDGCEFVLEDLTERARKIAFEVKLLDQNLEEKQNLIVVLQKAKQSYLTELKSEMISSKSGMNFIDIEE